MAMTSPNIVPLVVTPAVDRCCECGDGDGPWALCSRCAAPICERCLPALRQEQFPRLTWYGRPAAAPTLCGWCGPSREAA